MRKLLASKFLYLGNFRSVERDKAAVVVEPIVLVSLTLLKEGTVVSSAGKLNETSEVEIFDFGATPGSLRELADRMEEAAQETQDRLEAFRERGFE